MIDAAPPLDHIALGATLYMPATRPDLVAATVGGRIPGLRSAVVCLEDSIRADEIPHGLACLRTLLLTMDRATAPWLPARPVPAIFVRPRDAAMLAEIIRLPGIDQVAGFVIPKATADTLPAWLAALAFDHHKLMPTLETREAFDQAEMRRLREQLLAIHDRVLCVRIGGNDLLQTIGARRSTVRTAYAGPLGPIIAALVATFAPWGFGLSAPVFETLDDPALLGEEVARDLEHGLMTKTAIHPRQIAVIESGYAVDAADYAAARRLLVDGGQAVFSDGRAMCEPATHGAWARALVRRAEVFGLAGGIGGMMGEGA